jgi:hypothetical protein
MPTQREIDRAAWDTAHGLKPGDYDKLTPAQKAALESKPLADAPQMWQVKFKSGQGQQVAGGSADEVRALMAKHYGEDYEIDRIDEIKK